MLVKELSTLELCPAITSHFCSIANSEFLLPLGMTNSKMSLWSIVSKMPPEEFTGLFEEFPYKLRCLLGDWLEIHPW